MALFVSSNGRLVNTGTVIIYMSTSTIKKNKRMGSDSWDILNHRNMNSNKKFIPFKFFFYYTYNQQFYIENKFIQITEV